MLSGSAALVSYMIALPLRNFSSNEVADDAEAFFKAHPVPQAAMGLARALEGVRYVTVQPAVPASGRASARHGQRAVVRSLIGAIIIMLRTC